MITIPIPWAVEALRAGRIGRRGVSTTTGAIPPTAGDFPSMSGNVFNAERQSGHPSRHTRLSLVTRPSPIHLRITSPRAGPYWPPAGGRTYQIASGASAMGSAAEGGLGGGAAAAAGTPLGMAAGGAPAGAGSNSRFGVLIG